MLDVARLLATVLSTHCLDASVDPDVDPVASGMQPECAISDVRFDVETPLPRCGMRDATTPERDTLPCWWIKEEPKCLASRHDVAVERAEDAPAGTNLLIRCAVGS